MKKYLSLISIWGAMIALLLTVPSIGRLRTDPADDFSFSLAAKPSAESFRLMPESRVRAVFEDRLSRFPRAETARLSKHFLELCHRHRFDPAFVLSLIEVESSFKIRAESPFGAVGLMQVMPATAVLTARALGLEVESVEEATHRLKDPFFNLSVGMSYLAGLRDRYRGLPPYYLVAAYNIGPAKMDELRARKHFTPVNTKRYYESIRKGLPGLRFYRRPI